MLRPEGWCRSITMAQSNVDMGASQILVCSTYLGQRTGVNRHLGRHGGEPGARLNGVFAV